MEFIFPELLMKTSQNSSKRNHYHLQKQISFFLFLTSQPTKHHEKNQWLTSRVSSGKCFENNHKTLGSSSGSESCPNYLEMKFVPHNTYMLCLQPSEKMNLKKIHFFSQDHHSSWSMKFLASIDVLFSCEKLGVQQPDEHTPPNVCPCPSKVAKKPRHWAQRVALPFGIATSRSTLYSCQAKMLKTSIWVGKICQSWRAKLEGKIWTVGLGHNWTNDSCLQIEHVRLFTFTPVSRKKTYWWEHKQREQCVGDCMWNHARLWKPVQHSARNGATSPKNLGLNFFLTVSSMYVVACIACGFFDWCDPFVRTCHVHWIVVSVVGENKMFKTTNYFSALFLVGPKKLSRMFSM